MKKRRGKWRTKRETGWKKERKRDRISLFGRGRARGSKFHPSLAGTFEHSLHEGNERDRNGTKKKKKKEKREVPSSLHAVYPDLWSPGSVTDEISMPMQVRPIFHIEISPCLATVGRVTYFCSSYEQMNELHLSYLQRALEPMSEKRSAPLPGYICFINFPVLYATIVDTFFDREMFLFQLFNALREYLLEKCFE